MVARQAEAGVDIVNDGEQSKPSYATYIKDRLNGFGGTGASYVFQDLEDYPGAKLATMAADEGRKHRKHARLQRSDQRQGHGRRPPATRRNAQHGAGGASRAAGVHERGLARCHGALLPQRIL